MLASASLGATLFTLFVLGGAAGEPVPAPPIPDTPAFRCMILHSLGGCAGVAKVSSAHFLVSADGQVYPTVLWRRGESISTTGRPEVDRTAIVVAIERSRDGKRQGAALRELLARLSERFPGISERVMTHAQVDGTRCGAASQDVAVVR